MDMPHITMEYRWK